MNKNQELNLFFTSRYVKYDFLFVGNVVNAVHHARVINREIKIAAALDDSELFSYAKQLQVP